MAQPWPRPLDDGAGSGARLSPAAAALGRCRCMLSPTLCFPRLLEAATSSAAVLAPGATPAAAGDRSQQPCPLLTAYTRRPVRPARATRGALATTRGVKALQAMEAAMSASCKPSAAPRRLGGGRAGRGVDVWRAVLRLDRHSTAPGHDLNAVMCRISLVLRSDFALNPSDAVISAASGSCQTSRPDECCSECSCQHQQQPSRGPGGVSPLSELFKHRG